ncbi:AI-2E family transporter [Paludisphaera mucosa]|uniref:AI-2E family transporter n=1 Tax=Paludisphaera mucosa TaxID=3030827 RepID=A0ABT6FAQ3_9BACT|nr:AI-2E family transporter [Paludisphaera mucosa]MDG3004607.1 AI-2E family transporter [Paludisphaera mucosa]
MNHTLPPPAPLPRDEFTRRVWIVAGAVLAVATAGAALVMASSVFLLLFAAVLLAILLRTAADAVARWTGLGPKWAFAVLLIVLALAAGGLTYLVGATAADQFSKLNEELPRSITRVRAYLQGSTWGREVLRWAPAAQDAVTDQPQAAASHVAEVFSTTFGAAGDLVVLLFVTLYLAASPTMYVDGLVRLVPPAGRPRAREVLAAVGERLKGWMLGQMVAMATVGLISGVGLWLVGVPQFLVLGLVAGILTAIPYVGPIVGALIGVLAALTQGPDKALWALLVFTVAESLEGYVITPLVQQRMSELPPVLTLVAIAVAGALFGVVGLIVAAPLAVALQTAVEELYVQDVLEDRDPDAAA